MREELDHETVTEERARLILIDRQGYRQVCLRSENNPVASEADSDYTRMAKILIERNEAPGGRKVAFIGGGFCIGPKLWGRSFGITVYEIEAVMERFCPQWVTFVPGDYKTTLRGNYDVIVYDLAEPPDEALLTSHLSPDGRLLVVE